MKNRIISLVLVTLMLISAMPMTGVFAADEATTTDSILIGETFNDVVTGGVPDDVFIIKRAGSGDLCVVEIPDAKNKSLFMKTESGGTTYIEKEIINPESAPLTLAFDMYLDNLGDFQLVNIVDSKGNVTPLFDVVDGKLMDGDEVAYTFEKNVWYYMEVGLNVKDKAYTVSVDNQKAIKKTEVAYSDFASLRLQLSATTQELKLDDITLFRADIVTGDVKYFKNSLLFLEPILQEEAKDIVSSGLLMYQNAKRAVKNGAELELNTPAKSFDKVLYAPVRFTIENLGGEVTWNAQDAAAHIVFKNKTHKIKNGLASICIDGTAAEERQKITDLLLERADALYQKKEELFGEEQMREVERVVLLQNVDKKWMDHLEAMDSLMEAIGLQAYAQRNPIAEYRLYGADMFDEMVMNIRDDTARMVMSIVPRPQQEVKRVEVAKVVSEGFAGGGSKPAQKKAPVVNKTPKVGRNDPCPCGSGKKYKKCCGASAAGEDEE